MLPNQKNNFPNKMENFYHAQEICLKSRNLCKFFLQVYELLGERWNRANDTVFCNLAPPETIMHVKSQNNV
jgi:hypothetical protein